MAAARPCDRGETPEAQRRRWPAAGAALGLGLLAAVGCGSREPRNPQAGEIQALEQTPWGEPQRVIAEVNGRTITRGDFYHRILRRFGTEKVLGGIIKEELFFQEAERLGIQVRTQEVEAEVERVFEEMAQEAGGRDALAKAYAREGIQMEAVREDLEREVYPQVVIAKVTKALRKVDDSALRTYYDTSYRHTRYRVRHIAYSFLPREGQTEDDVNRLKLEAYNRAARAADRVRKGADFAALASAESEDPVTRARGGDLGQAIHEDTEMSPELKKAIFKLRAGEVSDPVENPIGGYHVLQVVEVLPSESFADCQEKMRTEILERDPDLREIEETLNALRGRATINVLGSPVLGPEKGAWPAGKGPGESPPPPGERSAEAGPPAGGEK
jgi:parvulin-like peptidyl-prolyl isomerase